MVIKNETQNNTGEEIINETQNNSKNEEEKSQEKVWDSESITEDVKNQSETEQRYNLCKNRAPNYSRMKTVVYLNAHVKNNLV